MTIRMLLSFIIYFFFTPSYAEDECLSWFKKAGLASGSDCNLNCSTLSVDMGTFDCPNQCEKLCKNRREPVDLPLKYPKGLTKGDRAMIAKRPKEALKVYQAKQKADDLTLKIFKQQGRNDESDAFRHLVWAALVTKDLGRDVANEFLNAHEDEDGQPKLEKEMDIFNNNVGSNYAVERTSNGSSLELDQIEKFALDKLKSNELKVLNSSKKKIPDGYYSK